MTWARRRWALHAAVAVASAAVLSGVVERLAIQAAMLEPPIIPTVHPTLTPSSAITTPLVLHADDTAVWRSANEQRMLLTGHVSIELGYRRLQAGRAAVFLTPSKEGGESTYEVAIYLVDNVVIEEPGRKGETTQTHASSELLVTSRIAQSVELAGTPVSRVEEDNPIVKRGDELRTELLTKPAPPVHIPRIVITEAEAALQSGWIARGPNNRIVIGPGDLAPKKNGPGGIPPESVAVKAPKPRPQVFATGDKVEYKTLGNERVAIITGAYLFRDTLDGKPPIELRAQRMVLFSPPEGAPTTNRSGEFGGASRAVTGVYLEGDVTLDAGQQSVKASRLYYDFTSDRAIMLDATLSTVDENRNVPLYMKAATIRQLARGEYAAKSVQFSTSEFYQPHYHIGASEIYLQDITPRDADNKAAGMPAYGFKAKDATVNVRGVPIFYWPYLAGDTNKNEIPLRRLRVGNSSTYGLSIITDWDLFGLAGQREPKGVRADLNLDYFGKRGPAGGVDSTWNQEEYHGLLKSYGLIDNGEDRLGAQRNDLTPQRDQRGRILARHMQELDDEWTLSLEASYISDPNFLEQFFQSEFDADKPPESSIYLKHQKSTEAFSILAKGSFNNFTASSNQVDDQFNTNKLPEAKYFRVGDPLFDTLTYYSESGVANTYMNFTNFTPNQIGLQPSFLGLPASAVPLTEKYKAYYQSLGWTTDQVLRGDSRHELDLPIQVGDAKITPYVTGRVTAWDTAFPEPNSGNTVRLWGAGGFRSSMEFWNVYDDVESTFWDLHRMRHVIEPEFTLFEAGSTKQRDDLQPFDPDVEGMSTASGTQLTIHQKWQTKRGGPGHWRNVDWIVLDVSWNNFWNKDQTGLFFPATPLRGYFDPSRPELSLVADSIDVNGVWRVGERVRVLGELNFNLDTSNLEQFATGIAVDQTDSLAYFIGNRYIDALNTDEWTVAVDYRLTKKYSIVASESYDFQLRDNILSSVTLIRRLPRFNTSLTVTYDANSADTSVVFSAWPEGFADMGFGNRATSSR